MNLTQPSSKDIVRTLASLLIMLFLLAGCAGSQAPVVFPTATATLVPSATFTLAPTPTLTPTPSATAIRTPPALPAPFQSSLQRPVDPPHTYIANTCQYLQDKWSSQNSLPGTIVIPLMFHSIMKPGDSIGANQISQKQFTELMGGSGSQRLRSHYHSPVGRLSGAQRQDTSAFCSSDRGRPPSCRIFQSIFPPLVGWG